MNDHGRIDQSLSLLAKRGTYEVLQAMYSRGGTATFAQIAAEACQALALLRALTVDGLVISYRCGSLDIEPSARTCFVLTAKGEAVAGHLARLQRWIAARSNPRSSRRPTP